MYRCGLSTTSINEILEMLSNQKNIHIRQTKTRHKIEITQKGLTALDALKTVNTVLQV